MAVQHRILTLKFVVIGLSQPVTRIVDVSASLRMAELHGLILPLFAWEDSASHRFIDHPIDGPRFGDDEYAGYARSATRRRVWEMEHWCRDADGHVSECEWTSTVGAAFDSLPFGSSAVLYYEYGSTQCPEWRYGEPCLARQLDIADGRHRHGWTIAISVDAVRSARRAEPAALLRGTGRAPLVEAGGPAAYEEMLGVLTDPMHAKRPELCSWIEDRIGVWATSQPLARADFDVEATRVLIASTRRGASDHRDPSPFRALLARTERWHPAHRIELLSAAQRAGVASGGLPDRSQAAAFTSAVAARLAALSSTRTESAPIAAESALVTSDPLSASFDDVLRRLRFAYRRSGVLLRSRAGDEALVDPRVLLDRYAARYWALPSDTDLAIAIALAVAEGLPDDELPARVEHVAGLRPGSIDRADIDPSVRYLATCGGASRQPLEGRDRAALARLVLRW
ncbi:plasmid pRiA4b ORF-3 family protein [Agromyces mariniharenae]|uniref:Plasmid pRiA4b ORF-3 family protein n=1 Tax=Agromyces mariniharenae TaxID=2604423 RepID=A0A5S4V448_9MICO|nr:plasmid pRiA4b ORF-3 family protein [Agromyces mariniharenae]TYL53784.1 plasmid pRiA4b ORF-3 family protein [Agromyces mariniharenae]